MNSRYELRAAIAGGLSLIAHLAIMAYVGWYAATPDLGFEIELPAEVDFGLTEGATVQTVASSTPQPTTPPGGNNPGGNRPGAALDGGVADAGVGDGGRRRRRRDSGLGEGGPADGGVGDGASSDARMLVASAARDGGDAASGIASAGGRDAAAGEGTAGDETRLPAGAAIALRIDMARVRRSPLAPDVRAFLAAIPDWQAVLGGSGIQPVDDLDRVLIASPNMQRSRMLLAGRYEGDTTRVREAVTRMATARGVDAAWRDEGGIQVAPWPNEDETARTIALVGPRHFTITRHEDLPRMLAVAQARAQRNVVDGEPPPESGPDALVSMEEGEALSLEVEGARRFVRGTKVRGIPTRMHVSVREVDPRRVAVEARGWYETPEQAIEARDFWNAARDQYARNALVALAGMAGPLRNGTIEAEGTVVRFRTQLGAQQLRLVLSYLQGAMQEQDRRRRDREANPTPVPP